MVQPSPSPRKPYVSPELEVLGTLQELTAGPQVDPQADADPAYGTGVAVAS